MSLLGVVKKTSKDEIQEGCLALKDSGDAYEALEIVVDSVISSMEKDVINCNMESEDCEQKLVYDKLRLEGANRFWLSLKKVINQQAKKASASD